MRRQKGKQIESHEVYAVFDSNGVIIYIGSGANNRHKHCTSGCSHVYELNKMHFNNEQIQVKLLHVNLTKENSITTERKLITTHQPRLNKQFMNSDTRKVSMEECKRLKDSLINIIIKLDKRNSLLDRFRFQVNDFIDIYKIQGLISGVRVKHRVMEPLKGKDKTSSRYTYFNTIFQYNSGILKLNNEIIEVLNAKEN